MNESRTEEAIFRGFFQNAVEGIYQTTADGKYIRANPALAQIYGYSSPEDLISGLTDIGGQLYVDRNRRVIFLEMMAERGMVRDFEADVYRRDGTIIHITENARAVKRDDGSIAYYEGTVEDITEKKRTEEKIRLLAKVFECVAEGIVLVDLDRRVQATNPAFVAMFAAVTRNQPGDPLVLFDPDHHDDAFADMIWREAESGRWQGEAMCRREDGSRFDAWLCVTAVRNPKGDLEHFVVSMSDISQRKAHEQKILYQANYDRLTDLPNRWFLRDRLEEVIGQAREAGGKVAVAFIDLNRFKQVNDSLGHDAGDALLAQTAARLRRAVRLSDTVGRLGGDEFLAIAPGIADEAGSEHVANRILSAFTQPFSIAGTELYCDASVGISLYPDHGGSADEILRNADMAMYRAKRRHGQRFSLYAEDGDKSTAPGLHLESGLRRAIKLGQFLLHYQPQIDYAAGQLLGAEALIRWHHPDFGRMAPDQFIPMAEDAGLIWEIGTWVMERACRQMMVWRAAGLGGNKIAVNLSAHQVHDPRLPETLERILATTGLPPGCLELELTESAMVTEVERAVSVITALKRLGVRIAVDDFGVGYSSLSYLSQFPIDTIKIDRSFVRDITMSAAVPAIIETIIGLAGGLACAVVAEGVENREQADALAACGCTTIQGFHISKPLDEAGFEAFARRPLLPRFGIAAPLKATAVG